MEQGLIFDKGNLVAIGIAEKFGEVDVTNCFIGGRRIVNVIRENLEKAINLGNAMIRIMDYLEEHPQQRVKDIRENCFNNEVSSQYITAVLRKLIHNNLVSVEQKQMIILVDGKYPTETRIVYYNSLDN